VAAIVTAVAELSKRNPRIDALLLALPITKPEMAPAGADGSGSDCDCDCERRSGVCDRWQQALLQMLGGSTCLAATIGRPVGSDDELVLAELVARSDAMVVGANTGPPIAAAATFQAIAKVKLHVARLEHVAAGNVRCLARFKRMDQLRRDEDHQLLRLRQQLGKLDLLILDELGYVPASQAGAELLFDVIATAYERNSLIVTTNLPLENKTEVLGSERLTGAALARLTHRCHILETKGESYRLQDAKRRKRWTA